MDFPSPDREIVYQYDGALLDRVLLPEGEVGFEYICSQKVGTVSMNGQAVTFGYDGPLVTSEALSGTVNQALSYAYNNDFAVTSFTYAGGTESCAYDQDGLPEQVTDGTLTQERTFNGYSEMDGLDTRVLGASRSAWSVTRDRAGRIVSRTESVDGAPVTSGYTYDDFGRLLNVTRDGTLVESYLYGPSGARTLETNLIRGIVDRTLSYSVEDHLLTAGDDSYTYDVDGFLVRRIRGADNATTWYDYGARGELKQVQLPDGRVIDYVNDPLGRRTAKKVDGVVKEKYLWQGMTRLLAVYDGADHLVMRFEYADSRMPVAMTRGGQKYYLTFDQVGSLRAVFDVSGTLVKGLDYDSFGNIVVDTNPGFPVPFGFAGGLLDRDTGLVRFGYRDYDPEVGRWTAKDPIGFAGGDTDLYGYCINNPVQWIDPNGLFSWHENWGGPNWTGGFQKSWDQLTPFERDLALNDPTRAPKTPQDFCYRDHDICYGETRMDHMASPCSTDLECRLNNCDKELRNCLVRLGFQGDALYEAQRIAAVGTFYVQPAVRSAIRENTKTGSSWIFLIRF